MNNKNSHIPSTTVRTSLPSHKRRLFFLDFIRAVAILLIIVHHYDYAVVTDYTIAPNNINILFLNNFLWVGWEGTIGVSLFIILSGFSLMISTNKHFVIRDYAKKRFLGIFPLFWISYIISALASFKNFPRPGNTFSLILTIIGFDGLLLYKIPNYYLIGEWFVGFILIMYILFPFLRWLLSKNQLCFCYALLLSGLIASNYYNFSMAIDRFPFCRLMEFGFGMIFALYYQSLAKQEHISNILLAFPMLFLVKVTSMPILFAIAAYGVIFFVGLTSVAQFINNKLLQTIISFLGKYSFGAFLLHHIILNIILRNFIGININYLANFILFIFVTSIIFAVSCLVTNFVELSLKKLR